jgi:putative membrane protein
MYTKTTFSTKQMVIWTRYETFAFIAMGVLWVSLFYFFDLGWLRIPWTPIALIGTAVAFVIGFQNNAAYDRIWEARKIWGGIVNSSRSFGMMVQDMVSNEHSSSSLTQEELYQEMKTLTYRHIAWITALRHAMRVRKSWETTSSHKTNTEWGIKTPEHKTRLEDDIICYLGQEDIDYISNKDNKQTAIIYQQSHHLKRLKDAGHIWEFSFLELENVLKELVVHQGKSERIKNFPYPRQFATLNHFFMWIFVFILPLALVPQFADLGYEMSDRYPIIGNLFVWFTIPFYVAVAWIFHTMERIGRTGENPFEGTSNDVPISTISRGIEIDLRQNLGEGKDEIPIQFPEVYNTQF